MEFGSTNYRGRIRGPGVQVDTAGKGFTRVRQRTRYCPVGPETWRQADAVYASSSISMMVRLWFV
jgi:hypothetical protein